MVSSSNTNLIGELDKAPNFVFTQTAWVFFPAVRSQRVPDSTQGWNDADGQCLIKAN